MRKPAALSAMFAAATITVGLAAGVTSAADNTETAPPPSAPSGADIFSNLTPEQQSCLIENAASLDPADMDAMMAVVDECGISLTDLTGTGSADPLSSEPLTSTAPADPFANIGIDAATQQCIADAVTATPPADDAAATAILTGCGASLTSIVTMIGAGGVGTSTPGASTAPTATTGDPIIDAMRTELESQGISLSDEQLTCLKDAVFADPSVFENAESDPAAMLPILEQCGIDLADIV